MLQSFAIIQLGMCSGVIRCVLSVSAQNGVLALSKGFCASALALCWTDSEKFGRFEIEGESMNSDILVTVDLALVTQKRKY